MLEDRRLPLDPDSPTDAGSDTQPSSATEPGSVPDLGGGRRLPRALSPFAHAAYRRLAVALVLQTFAAGMWTVATVWEVIRLGGGPGQLSLVASAGALGLIIPALLGGVVADRIPQKRILVVVTALEFACMAVVAGLSIADRNSVTALAAVAFAIGVAMAFYYPAYTAWIPALVPESALMAVNGFEGMVRPAAQQAFGPALAGAIIGALNPGAAIAAAAGISLLGVLALMLVPSTPVRRDLKSLSEIHPIAAALRDVREGFVYMVRTPWLLATLLFVSLLVLCTMGPLEVLAPFLIKDQLGGDAQDHALVLAAYGVGAAGGSLVMGGLPMPRRYLTFMNIAWGLGTVPLVLMALAPEIWVVVLAAFVLGVLFGAPVVIWGTLLQRRVPPHLLGRVSSLDFFVSLALMPVSMALAGPVSNWIGVKATFIAAGLIPPVLAVIAIVAFRLPADEISHPLREQPTGPPQDAPTA